LNRQARSGDSVTFGLNVTTGWPSLHVEDTFTRLIGP